MAKGRPSRAARSRATPAMLQASGRLASTATSNTTSGSSPRAPANPTPGAAPSTSLSRRIPSWSSERRSSRPEHSIPLETTPFILRLAMAKPPGSTAPTGARGTRSPTSKFQAPQTTSIGAVPSWTTTRRIRSAPSMGASSSTWATTTSAEALADPLDALDHQTQVVQDRGQVSGIPLEGGEVTKPRKRYAHDGPLRLLASDLGHTTSELTQEAEVVVGQDPHVGDLVPHLRAPVDAEAEGEPGPAVGIDAHGVEDGGVDHATAAELDPACL